MFTFAVPYIACFAMKKSFIFALLVLIVTSFVSCHKEPAKTITFGDTKGMKITPYGLTIAYNDEQLVPLDMDDNGEADILLKNYYDGIFQIPSLISNYPQEEPFQAEYTDRIVYTHFEYSYSYDNNTGKVLVHMFVTESLCDKIAEEDEEKHSYDPMVQPHDSNDLLGLDNTFIGNEFKLFAQDHLYPEWLWYETEDSIFYHSEQYITHCENFPTETPFYIGIRSCEKPYRLGWVKLMLHSVNNGENVNVELIETAIQE